MQVKVQFLPKFEKSNIDGIKNAKSTLTSVMLNEANK